MTFDEWWSSYVKPASIYTLKETAEDAWEAGIQEGLRRNREWVGLNGLEQKELMAMNSRYAVFETEAKLKEKNT